MLDSTKQLMVAIDGHMGNSIAKTWDLSTAKAVMHALESYDLMFFEEPLHYTDPWSYAELCKSTSIPIAGGECLTGLYEWKVFSDIEGFDIGQPDASFTGGMGEFMKIATMLESRGKKNRHPCMGSWRFVYAEHPLWFCLCQHHGTGDSPGLWTIA